MQRSLQLYSNIYLHVMEADYIRGDHWWEDAAGRNWWNRTSMYDFDMIYYVKAGRFDLHMDGEKHRISQGQMVYIPAGTHLKYDFDGKTQLEKFYTHFYLQLGRHPIKESFQFCPVITVKDTARADRIFQLLMGSTGILGRKGVLLQLVEFFLQESQAAISPVDAMQEAAQYICDHCEETLSVRELARQSGYSKDHFTRRFKETIGRTPRQYMNDMKLDQAKKLLRTTDMSISRIAATLGFCDAGYFTNFFCEKAGVTPSYYRKQRIE